LGDLNSDNPVKSLEIVMPDPVSGTGQARSGIQNALKLLDSGFRRNDGKGHFPTFYDTINSNNRLKAPLNGGGSPDDIASGPHEALKRYLHT
jgi:hypothetical protein